jgi:hypothetical protein
MVENTDRKEIYLSKLVELSEARLDPKAASVWAQQEEANLDEEFEVGTPEYELLSLLSIADSLNEHGKYLYSTDDFKQWLVEFKAEYNN